MCVFGKRFANPLPILSLLRFTIEYIAPHLIYIHLTFLSSAVGTLSTFGLQGV